MEQLLRDLSRVAFVGRDLGDVVREILAIAAHTTPGADAASITLLREDDTGFTAAHHGEAALAADEMQYQRGHGPCMDAARGGVLIRIEDMREESRFRDYGPRVAERGIRSSLSVPLPYQGASIGALNLYCTRPAAFGSTEAVEAALQVAEAIAVAVLNAHSHAQLGHQARHLQRAMESRAVIEQAKGVLIAQRRITAAQAFEILRDASQRYNRKLRDIAAGVVSSAAPRPPCPDENESHAQESGPE